MSREIYNKYGAMCDEEVEQVSDKVYELIKTLLDNLTKDGCPLSDIRLAGHYVNETGIVAMNEHVLRIAMKMRKKERNG